MSFVTDRKLDFRKKWALSQHAVQRTGLGVVLGFEKRLLVTNVQLKTKSKCYEQKEQKRSVRRNKS